MKISAVRILNYKGFLDTGFIELNKSWNVVVGQNNAGKTAFIEAFRFSRNDNRPHRNISIPRDQPISPRSRFAIRLPIERDWLRKAWLRRGGTFDLPVAGRTADSSWQTFDYNNFWAGDDLAVELELGGGSSPSSPWPSHRLFDAQSEQQWVQWHPTADREVGSASGPMGGGNDGLPQLVQDVIAEYVYTFDAKRFALGECAHEDSSILRDNASNLPAVLIKMMGNPDLFREFVSNVSAIFPSIKDVTVTTKGANFEIRLWSFDPSTRRDDLSVPLNESGTGVSQVLAILYVAMTNKSGVIAIDEPNSFLHPGAAKKLIQILKRYPDHQYIISTHSPEVIGAAQPATLHLVRFDGEQSRIETFGVAEIDAKRMMLEEVGASISDVFSAERVIWVEGPTERECFDLIVERVLGGPIVGLAFVALRNTGDFEARNADSNAVLDVYDSISRGGSILPVTVAFSFDGEGKTQKQIEDLKRRCGGRANILPRRMTENYLLNPSAISRVLNDLGEREVTAAMVEDALKKKSSSRFPRGFALEFGSVEYFERVDGANLLSDIFHDITDGRHDYRKVRDAVRILDIVLEDDPQSVAELVEFVRALLA